jgi:hypothetical protein
MYQKHFFSIFLLAHCGLVASCIRTGSPQNSLFGNVPSKKSQPNQNEVIGFLNEDLPFIIRQTLNLPANSDILKHHLESITELKIVEKRRYSYTNPFSHFDFEKFPNLEKITVEFHNLRWLSDLLRESSQKTQRLHLTYTPQDSVISSVFSEKPVPLKDLSCSLNSLKRLKSLQISQLNSDELLVIDRTLKNNPVISLQISHLRGDLLDSHLDALNKIPKMRHFALGLELPQLKTAQSQLKSGVKSVKIKLLSPQSADPFDIESFRFFKNAEYFTIINGNPKNLSPKNTIFQWMYLFLDNENTPFSNTPPKELPMEDKFFPKLVTFLNRPSVMTLPEPQRTILDSRKSMILFERSLSILETLGHEKLCSMPSASSSLQAEATMLEKIMCWMKF